MCCGDRGPPRPATSPPQLGQHVAGQGLQGLPCVRDEYAGGTTAPAAQHSGSASLHCSGRVVMAVHVLADEGDEETTGLGAP